MPNSKYSEANKGKKSAALTRLKSLAEQPFDDDNYRSVMDSLKSESDRATVVIAGSLLDDELSSLIRKVMRPLNAEDAQRLFGFDGPAGTFSSRILLAYELRLIDANDRRLLNTIRESATHVLTAEYRSRSRRQS